MAKYRIIGKEQLSPLPKYRVQKKILWFWITQKHGSCDYLENFYNFEDAQAHLDELVQRDKDLKAFLKDEKAERKMPWKVIAQLHNPE